MPLSSVLIVTGIAAAFALFAIVLAWGEHQTRNLRRDEAPKNKQDQQDTDIRKAA